MECAQHQLFSNKHKEISTSTSADIKKLCIFNIFPFPVCSLSSVIWNLWGKILIFKLNRVYFPLTVITAIPPGLGYNSMKLMWKTSVSLYSLLISPDINYSQRRENCFSVLYTRSLCWPYNSVKTSKLTGPIMKAVFNSTVNILETDLQQVMISLWCSSFFISKNDYNYLCLEWIYVVSKWKIIHKHV